MSTAKENIAKLPEFCYSVDNRNGNLIKICAGVMGFYPQHHFGYIRMLCKYKSTKEVADDLNKELGVTPIQREAMEIGSMFGWEVPGADVDSYKMAVVPA